MSRLTMTIEEILADIADSAPMAIQSEPEIEAFHAFHKRQSQRSSAVCIAAVLVANDFIANTRKVERGDAHRLVAIELVSAAVFILARIKREQGETFSPARFAISCYEVGLLTQPTFDVADTETVAP